MEHLDAKARLKRLAESANISIDSNIPIRRYYRSGNEMLRMAKVYAAEGNIEAAYVLYLKYITLFLEKVKSHRDFSHVLPTEKKKTTETLKLTLSISEELKNKLNWIYEEEHRVWLVEEEERRQVEEHNRKLHEEEKRKRMLEDRLKAEMIEKDRQYAVWAQSQIDQGLEIDPSKQPAHIPDRQDYQPDKYKDVDEISLPTYGQAVFNDPSAQSNEPSAPSNEPSAPLVSSDLSAALSNFAPAAATLPDIPSAASIPAAIAFPTPAPRFDRSSKPTTTPPVVERPAIPDRTSKPTFGVQGTRSVIVPEKLISKFLAIAKSNSDRDVETLGMLGGKLAQNKFTVTHLLIPKQSGKSDRCDLEGHEELFDIYEKDDIILVGWIHTHPAFDVFLSSVDMHNQYEYQNMLHEFIAIVCSIKFNETGYLSLTDHGMKEIGECRQENFHPHSKEPPLFASAGHVTVDKQLDIVLRDLRI